MISQLPSENVSKLLHKYLITTHSKNTKLDCKEAEGVHFNKHLRRENFLQLDKMTKLRKTSLSMAEQLPKQMARILYNTLIQETQRSSADLRAMSDNEPRRQNQEIPSQDGLLTVVEPIENSTWRIRLHKRKSNTI